MTYTMRDLLNMLKGNPDLGVDDPQISPLYPQNIPPQGGLTKLSEHDLQQAVIDECDRRALSNPLWGMIFAIPNGGHRNKATAGKLKAEGVRAGIPDLFLPVARKECHGLFLELKVGSNKATENQMRMIDRLKLQGYAAAVIWDLRMAINLIEWYLEGE